MNWQSWAYTQKIKLYLKGARTPVSQQHYLQQPNYEWQPKRWMDKEGAACVRVTITQPQKMK